VLAYLEEIEKQQQTDSNEENYFNLNQLKYIVMDMWSGQLVICCHLIN
jgi:hypothetical protein